MVRDIFATYGSFCFFFFFKLKLSVMSLSESMLFRDVFHIIIFLIVISFGKIKMHEKKWWSSEYHRWIQKVRYQEGIGVASSYLGNYRFLSQWRISRLLPWLQSTLFERKKNQVRSHPPLENFLDPPLNVIMYNSIKTWWINIHI